MQEFSIWKALLAEFLGTFTLVFIGASAVALTIAQGGSLLVSAFAFGLALMTIIYVWGSYSGAHVNPAVSFGFAVAGQMNWGLMLAYWVAQLLGGILAAALVAWFFGTSSGAGASIGVFTNSDAWKAVIMEALLTFFLVLAYLFIYRNPMLAIISGLAIGLVLTFAMLAGGYGTGASTNPARSLGPALFSNNMGTYWIYIVGPLLGALVAALIYKLFTANYNSCYKVDECGKKILDCCGRPLKEYKRPILDECGKQVKDCNGCVQYETIVKHEVPHGFMQENKLTMAANWLTSKSGVDARYLAQEAAKKVKGAKAIIAAEAAEAAMPGGKIEAEVEVDETIIITSTSALPQMKSSLPAVDEYAGLDETIVQSVSQPAVPSIAPQARASSLRIPSLSPPIMI